MALTSQQQIAGTTDGLLEPSVGHFWSLLKPRVMSLVVFTGFAGMYLAPMSLHPLVFAIALFAIAAGAGAMASQKNQNKLKNYSDRLPHGAFIFLRNSLNIANRYR